MHIQACTMSETRPRFVLSYHSTAYFASAFRQWLRITLVTRLERLRKTITCICIRRGVCIEWTELFHDELVFRLSCPVLPRVQFLLQPLHSILIAAFNGNTFRPPDSRSLSPFVVVAKHVSVALLRYSSFICSRVEHQPHIETTLWATPTW